MKSAALLIMRDQAGGYIAPGSVAKLNGSGAENFVGYDGQLWIEGLESRNTLVVENENGTCSANFTYTPDPGNQVTIDPVECK
jgi:outer membrane usher protein